MTVDSVSAEVRTTRFWRREGTWLAIIVLLGLALRLGLAMLPRVIRWDEPDYLWLGKSLLTGHGYTINGVPELHYTPLFPVLAGAIYLLTGNPEAGSAFWVVLLGALLAVPGYYLARRLYGRQVALLSAVLLALYPALSSAVLYWGTMTEPLFVLIVYTALLVVAVALEEDKLWAWATVGALLALAYLSRPEGIVWLGSFLALCVLSWVLRGTLLRWRTLARLGIVVGVFLLLAMPYAVYLHRYSGKWLATGKLSITYAIGEAVLERAPVLYDQVTASLDGETGEMLWWSSKRFERGMVDILADDPLGFARRTWQNVRAMRGAVFAPTVFPLFLLAPVVLGWFREPWKRRRLRQEALLWFGALPVLAFLPFHVEVRFFSPAFPALLIWLAAGIWSLAGWLGETISAWRGAPASPAGRPWRQGLWAGLILAPVLVYGGLVHLRTIERGQADLGFAHKAAGLWLRENTAPDAAIMSRDLAVSLYAERGFVASPRADYAQYLAYARRKGASYLLVDERELRVLRPHLAFLLDESNPPPELQRVYSTIDDRGRTIIYRIKD